MIKKKNNEKFQADKYKILIKSLTSMVNFRERSSAAFNTSEFSRNFCW